MSLKLRHYPPKSQKTLWEKFLWNIFNEEQKFLWKKFPWNISIEEQKFLLEKFLWNISNENKNLFGKNSFETFSNKAKNERLFMRKELGNPGDSLKLKSKARGFVLDGSSLWEQREIFETIFVVNFPKEFASEGTACRKIKKMISPLISELEKLHAKKQIIWLEVLNLF